MGKQQFCIGQEVVMNKEFKLEDIHGEKEFKVKSGDRAIVTSNGFLRFLTGELTGCISKMSEKDFCNGYDCESIANFILNELKSKYGFVEILENDINEEEVLKDIKEALMKIF